jgi:hypothetical protein
MSPIIKPDVVWGEKNKKLSMPAQAGMDITV